MASIPDRWSMLFVLFFARTEMALQFQSVASVGPLLMDALAIDFARLGTLIGLYMLPGVFFALPGGMLGQRFGAKRIVLVGLAFMAAGGVLTSLDSFIVSCAGRLVSGTGAVLINVMMTKMVADWFAGREIVTAMAIFIVSWPLGLAIALIGFPPFAVAYGWSAVMSLTALLALGCLAIVAFAYRDPSGIPDVKAEKFQINLSRREWLLVSLAGFIWGTYNVAYIVLISFLPEFFTVRGYSLPEASRLISLLGWALIFFLPLAGYLAERFHSADLLMFGGFGAVMLGAVALPFVDIPIPLFAIIVLAIGVPGGLIMALPAQALRPENRAIGIGLFFTFYYAIMAVLPAFAGVARDLSGSTAAPALFSAAMMSAAALALVGFRSVQRRPVVFTQA